MLYGWMKSLIIYLILSGIVMNITPGKNYKRYINSFIGLIILIILSEPLSYIFHLSSGDIKGFANDFTSYMGEGGELAYDNIYNYYEMSLNETIKHDISDKGYMVLSVETITDEENNILKCTIYLEKNSSIDTAAEDEVKKYISEVYNVDVNNIYIVRR